MKEAAGGCSRLVTDDRRTRDSRRWSLLSAVGVSVREEGWN